MDLDGKEYRPQMDHLFCHRVRLKMYSARGKILGEQICWIPPEYTYDSADRLRLYPEYYKMQEKFSYVCRKLGFPFHNGIAFWDKLLNAWSKLNILDVNFLVLCATCNYGDFFTYATAKALPKNIVCLEDLNDLREAPSIELKQDISNQIDLVTMNLPELVLSTDYFNRLRNAWNFHLQTVHLYQRWRKFYDQLKFSQYTETYSHSFDDLIPLVRIFRQYIHLLNEHKNSARYQDFEACYEEFEERKTNSLFFSFDQIVLLLNTHKELALIAPVYLLGIFQKLTTKLYKGLSTESTTQLKISLGTFSNAKPQLYDSAKSNTKVPRNIQVITYQILAIYFQESKIVQTNYDPALCDHILQSSLPLIGQTYFKIDESHVNNIIDSGKCYHYTDFEQSDQWVHFLLGEINKRLTYSLSLYPESIPKISFTDLMPPRPWPLIDKAKKLVDSSFIEKYLRIFILPSDGLGCPRISKKIQVELAELMDQTLSKAKIYPKLFEGAYASKLLAYETGFHQICTDMIYDQYHEKVLCFLYGFFQSDIFSHGPPIPTTEQPPVWPAPQYAPNKLNIVNRPNSESN